MKNVEKIRSAMKIFLQKSRIKEVSLRKIEKNKYVSYRKCVKTLIELVAMHRVSDASAMTP